MEMRSGTAEIIYGKPFARPGEWARQAGYSECKIDKGLHGQRYPVENIMEKHTQEDASGKAEKKSKGRLHQFNVGALDGAFMVRMAFATKSAIRCPPDGERCMVSPKSVRTKPWSQAERA